MKTWFSHVMLFLAGGAGMFLLERLPVFRNEQPNPLAQVEPSRTKTATTIAMSTDAGRINSAHREKIRGMMDPDAYDARKAFTGQLSGKDVPDLLAVLLEEAVPDGTDYYLKDMLDAALEAWVKEDFHAALAWAASQPKPKVRRQLQRKILDQLAETDPIQASDLALDIHQGDTEFDASSVTFTGVSKLCNTSGNEKKIADLLRKTADRGPSASSCGITVTFAENFSYETLLNEIAAMKREGIKAGTIPMGMLTSWAKDDAEAAHAWYLVNGDVGHEEWDNLFKGVISSFGQQGAADWFVGKFDEASESMRATMSEAFHESISDPGQAMALADSMARKMEPEAAEQFVGKVLKRRLQTVYADERRYDGLSLLSWYPTPEARADLIVEWNDANRAIKLYSEKQLATYGITRPILEAAVERRKANENR